MFFWSRATNAPRPSCRRWSGAGGDPAPDAARGVWGLFVQRGTGVGFGRPWLSVSRRRLLGRLLGDRGQGGRVVRGGCWAWTSTTSPMATKAMSGCSRTKANAYVGDTASRACVLCTWLTRLPGGPADPRHRPHLGRRVRRRDRRRAPVPRPGAAGVVGRLDSQASRVGHPRAPGPDHQARLEAGAVGGHRVSPGPRASEAVLHEGALGSSPRHSSPQGATPLAIRIGASFRSRRGLGRPSRAR